jgi:hypothetical protein
MRPKRSENEMEIFKLPIRFARNGACLETVGYKLLVRFLQGKARFFASRKKRKRSVGPKLLVRDALLESAYATRPVTLDFDLALVRHIEKQGDWTEIPWHLKLHPGNLLIQQLASTQFGKG